MAVDAKYGKVVTERGDIGEDEPVFILRAQDAYTATTIGQYLFMCVMNPDTPRRHLTMVMDALNDIRKWQHENGSRFPTSESSRELLA
jgi:hypothetical protein